MTKVFVFGTLKQGFPNFRSNRGCKMAGDFRTVETYPLYLVGERYVPWLVLNEGIGVRIRGEVYEVSDEALVEMDALEQVNRADGYQRIELAVKCESAQAVFGAQVYVKSVSQLEGVDVRETLQDEYTLEHASKFRRRDRSTE